jgi:hypothetical protein
MNIKDMVKKISGLPAPEAIQIIEEEQEKIRPYFNYMVELNKLHYDLNHPGEAERLGLT